MYVWWVVCEVCSGCMGGGWCVRCVVGVWVGWQSCAQNIQSGGYFQSSFSI